MPRRPRVQVAGLYHVWMHAVENTPLFSDDYDRHVRLGLLAEAVQLGKMRCHFVCLMGNHEHLLISVGDDLLAQVMQGLNRNYAGAFNHRHGRRGRVYWAPYGSKLIVTDSYLWVLLGYLALNPEWAGHGRAEEYLWSSFPSLIGKRRAMSFVDETPLLDAVGGGPDARARIADLVANARVLGRARVE